MVATHVLRNLVVRVAGLTDVGRKRQHNEDSFAAPGDAPLAVVADGMGGHASGEVASRIAVETVVEYLRTTSEDRETTWPYKLDRYDRFDQNRLVSAVKLANTKIWETAKANEGKKGMGTTVVAALFADDQALIAHVGDSRCYRVRAGRIAQLTEDHSLLNDYIRMKKLRADEAQRFAHKNVIVRALGMKEQVQVDLQKDAPRVGDTYVLCSDGLSGMISDAEIEKIVEEEDDLEQICAALIRDANARGGVDNITAVVARVEKKS